MEPIFTFAASVTTMTLGLAAQMKQQLLLCQLPTDSLYKTGRSSRRTLPSTGSRTRPSLEALPWLSSQSNQTEQFINASTTKRRPATAAKPQKLIANGLRLTLKPKGVSSCYILASKSGLAAVGLLAALILSTTMLLIPTPSSISNTRANGQGIRQLLLQLQPTLALFLIRRQQRSSGKKAQSLTGRSSIDFKAKKQQESLLGKKSYKYS